MKRRSREISVFSTSAIDLFASAMGAFIIIALILIVNKPDESVPVPTEPLEDRIQQLQQALEDARQAQASAEAAAAAATAEAQAAEAEAANRPAAMLGIVTDAKSFVLLLDMSGSMEEYAEITKQTLGEVLESLGSAKKAQIMGFQESDNRVVFPSWQQQRIVVPMTPQNVASARAFVETATTLFDGGTPTRAALLEALEYDAEAILLCSDGAPTRGDQEDDAASIVDEITRLNGGRKRIYTVALGNFVEKPQFAAFLSSLSAANGGKFIGVFNPPTPSP